MLTFLRKTNTSVFNNAVMRNEENGEIFETSAELLVGAKVIGAHFAPIILKLHGSFDGHGGMIDIIYFKEINFN